jgi:hypothetical protein
VSEGSRPADEARGDISDHILEGLEERQKALDRV